MQVQDWAWLFYFAFRLRSAFYVAASVSFKKQIKRITKFLHDFRYDEHMTHFLCYRISSRVTLCTERIADVPASSTEIFNPVAHLARNGRLSEAVRMLARLVQHPNWFQRATDHTAEAILAEFLDGYVSQQVQALEKFSATAGDKLELCGLTAFANEQLGWLLEELLKTTREFLEVGLFFS